jgi:MSHA biogenesis protein MshP
MKQPVRTQGGFVLITAVLLITGIVAVAVVSAVLLSGRSVDTARGFEALRVHYAARSGLDAAAAQAVAGGCGSVSGTLNVEGFTVNLGCQAWTVNEAGTDYPVFRLTATAARGSIEAGTLVSRTIRSSLADPP